MIDLADFASRMRHPFTDDVTPLPDAVPPTPEQVKRAEELLQVQRYPG